MNEETKTDGSMDALADALGSLESYVTEDGAEVQLYKATVGNYPTVLAVVKSISKNMAEMHQTQGGTREPADNLDMVFGVVENNMPAVLNVLEALTSLDRKAIDALTLTDLLAICTRLWLLNQRFFMQAASLMPLLFKQSLPSQEPPAPNRAARRAMSATTKKK